MEDAPKATKKTAKKKSSITIYEAFANAQAEMQDISPDGTNPHFKSAYATLGGILSEIRPVLAKHGISISQTTEPKWVYGQERVEKDGAITTREVAEMRGHMIYTTLTYKDGNQLPTSSMFIPAGSGIQQFGSALTYCRRYMMQSICGVGTDLDDDGNLAQQNGGGVRGADAVKEHLKKK